MFSKESLQNTVVSFVLMLALWTYMFGSWQFALAFLVLLGIHEMGHYAVARVLGQDVSMPIFTPIGALINMNEMPKNAFEEALMAFGGPFIGSLGALGALLLGYHFHSPILIYAAQAGFFLNLFNLIPLSPLDGGRISMAVDRRMWILGVPMFAFFVYASGFGIMSLLIAFFIARSAWQDIQFRSHQALTQPTYFAIGAGRRIGVLVAYFGLVASLLYALGVL